MARFNICFCNSAGIINETVCVIGRKIKAAKDRDHYDYYSVKRKNKYGIKWVIINVNNWQGSDIATNGRETLPSYSYIRIYKLYK